MIYEVTLKRSYNTLRFKFDRAADAVSFMHTAKEANIPGDSDDAERPVYISMELKEGNNDEETV